MDEAAFGAVERAIRGLMTAEQCVRIERVARESVASRPLEALIGGKLSMLPPRDGARIAARWYRQAWPGREWLRSHLRRADEYAACTNAQARGLAGLCRGTRRAAVTRLATSSSSAFSVGPAWKPSRYAPSRS